MSILLAADPVWVARLSRRRAVLEAGGEQRAEARTPGAGLLSGIRRQPLPCEGDLRARILTKHELGEVAETYLMGHGQ